MSHPILDNEPTIRLGFFFGILAVMAFWEKFAPRRPLSTSKKNRWFSNLSIVAIDTLVLRLLLPVTAVSVAIYAQKQGGGVLNWVALPQWVAFMLGVAALDLVIYLQHVMFHAVPALWRLHMMHHTDLDFDVTTGVRFHPVEIILSMGIKVGAVILLGVSALGVFIFEILLNGTSMFNHGNIRFHVAIDRWLRFLVVTPEMHRVHHSVIIRETNSNFGFNLPWWDRLLGTYKSQPAAGHAGMTIGLSHFRDPKRLSLLWLLALPFIEKPGQYPLSLGNQP